MLLLLALLYSMFSVAIRRLPFCSCVRILRYEAPEQNIHFVSKRQDGSCLTEEWLVNDGEKLSQQLLRYASFTEFIIRIFELVSISYPE